MSRQVKETRMTIGALAKAAGVGVETIRYYQRRHLIESPPAQTGYRSYGPEHAERLLFIRRAQSVGFSLDEVEELLRLNDASDHQSARTLAEQKIADIETRIDHLNSMAAALRHLVCACKEGGDEMPCPIIRMALDREAASTPSNQRPGRPIRS